MVYTDTTDTMVSKVLTKFKNCNCFINITECIVNIFFDRFVLTICLFSASMVSPSIFNYFINSIFYISQL